MEKFLRSLYHALPSPPSTNYNLNQTGIDVYSLVPLGGIVLDIGSGVSKSNYAFASVRPDLRSLRFLNLDLESGPCVNLRGDVHDLPLKSDSVGCVTCISTLEYVRDPQRAIAEIYRILKPGGLVYLNVPFVFPYHPPPEDLYRFSTSGIRTLAERFEEIRAGFNRGPASTFCHLFVRFLAISLCFHSRRTYGILVDLFTWILFWIKYLDRWIGRYEVARVIYSGTFFLGRKPA